VTGFAMSIALAKKPGERFAQCRQFATVLTERAKGASTTDRTTEAVPACQDHRP
jgi:hypothetical protein